MAFIVRLELNGQEQLLEDKYRSLTDRGLLR